MKGTYKETWITLKTISRKVRRCGREKRRKCRWEKRGTEILEKGGRRI